MPDKQPPDRNLGSSQRRRFPAELDPAYVPIDDRSEDDLLRFASEFARIIRFYDFHGATDRDWQAFFSEAAEGRPQQALFRTFLKLFGHAQRHLNRLSEKHLRFHFERILQIPMRGAVPDRVFVAFGLRRDLRQHLLPAGTELQAGKDAKGIDLIYRTEQDIVVNQAAIENVKSLFVDKTQDFRIYVNHQSYPLPPQADKASGGWKLFGTSQYHVPKADRTMADGEVGWAIASPLLLCREGRRVFTLVVTFTQSVTEGAFLRDGFRICFSGEKDWLDPILANARRTDDGGVLIEAEVPPTFPPIVPMRTPLSGEIGQGSSPIMKILLRPDTEEYPYPFLRGLRVKSVVLSVSVSGVRNLLLANDTGRLDPNKPFPPFGMQPVLGSQFFIGSPEVFQKRLDSFALSLAWHGLPTSNFETYYREYSQQTIQNDAFTVRLRMLLDQSWNAILREKEHLFNLADLSETHVMTVDNPEGILSGRPTPIPYHPNRSPSDFKALTADLPAGFIKMELTGPTQPFLAFGHQAFPELYTKAILSTALSGPTAPGSAVNLELPRPPYTPHIKEISLAYSATVAVHFENERADHRDTRIYQINPFGSLELKRDYLRTPYLLGQFDDEGQAFFGIRNLHPPETLTILLKAVDGSADTERTITAGDVRWHYLAGNDWVEMDAFQRVSDSTSDLQGTGVLTFSLPATATVDHTLMPSGLHWIRASLAQNTAGIADVQELRTQVVIARFENRENDLGHLRNPLPTGSISKLVSGNPAVRTVDQPFASFGGRAPETSLDYYIRVSERLRHKSRALTSWDYERLVLDRFPSIYQAKCVPAYDGRKSVSLAGAVTVAVVPDMRNIGQGSRLEPKADARLLDEIRDYLQQRASPFVAISVENPVYERLVVQCKVRFEPGLDEGFHARRLNDELVRFLSPWLFDEGVELVFGGRMHRSEVLAFVERRSYVDFVTDFRLNQLTQNVGPIGVGSMAIGRDFVVGHEVLEARASTPRSIIVSAERHEIHVWRAEGLQGTPRLGVTHMAIGVDFVVS